MIAKVIREVGYGILDTDLGVVIGDEEDGKQLLVRWPIPFERFEITRKQFDEGGKLVAFEIEIIKEV